MNEIKILNRRPITIKKFSNHASNTLSFAYSIDTTRIWRFCSKSCVSRRGLSGLTNFFSIMSSPAMTEMFKAISKYKRKNMNEIKDMNRKSITIKILNSRLKYAHGFDFFAENRVSADEAWKGWQIIFIQSCPHQRWQKCSKPYQNIKRLDKLYSFNHIHTSDDRDYLKQYQKQNQNRKENNMQKKKIWLETNWNQYFSISNTKIFKIGRWKNTI